MVKRNISSCEIFNVFDNISLFYQNFKVSKTNEKTFEEKFNFHLYTTIYYKNNNQCLFQTLVKTAYTKYLQLLINRELPVMSYPILQNIFYILSKIIM